MKITIENDVALPANIKAKLQSYGCTITNKDDKNIITKELDSNEKKAFEQIAAYPTLWTIKALHSRILSALKQTISEKTVYNGNKLSDTELKNEISKLSLTALRNK